MAQPKKQHNTRYYTDGSPANTDRAPRQRPYMSSYTAGVDKPTVTDDHLRNQQKRLTGNQLLDRDAVEKKRKAAERKERRIEHRKERRIQQFSKSKQKLQALAAVQGGVKGTAKTLRKARVVRATWIAAGLCVGLFYYQIAFWIISMAGAGIESIGDILANSADSNLGKFAAWVAGNIVSFIVPGQSIFVAGYVISLAIAWIQLLITGFIYIVNGINPFKGYSLLASIFVFAFSTMPFLGIVPWAFVWMFFVFKTNVK